MCFFGKSKPKVVKPKAAPTVPIPQPQPIENQTPAVQSGLDAQQQTKTKKKSIFQVDLSLPAPSTSGGPSSPSSQEIGPAVR